MSGRLTIKSINKIESKAPNATYDGQQELMLKARNLNKEAEDMFLNGQ